MGKQVLFGIHFIHNKRGLRVNDIRGLFPKDSGEWLNWISKDRLLRVDKERVLNLISQQQINPADVAYLDLEPVTKVVEIVENPKYPEPSDELGLKANPDGTVYFRRGVNPEELRSLSGARGLYGTSLTV